MVTAGIITKIEADSLAVGRRFTVSEYYALGKAGILCEDERIELLDGEILVMPPIGDNHEFSTDELTCCLFRRWWDAPGCVCREASS